MYNECGEPQSMNVDITMMDCILGECEPNANELTGVMTNREVQGD